MRYTGKLVGGLIGLVFGPVAALAGVLLGHQVDEHLDKQDAQLPGPEELQAISERFFRATFRVMGYVAKADGRVSEQEISAARADGGAAARCHPGAAGHRMLHHGQEARLRPRH